MAATKTKSNGSNEQRAKTAAQNASLDIDFGTKMAEDDFARHVGPGPWQRKLDALYEGVQAGKAAHGEYVRIGSFNSASGANTAKNGITSHPERLLRGSFEFKTKVVHGTNGNRSSELWACVMPEDAE